MCIFLLDAFPTGLFSVHPMLYITNVKINVSYNESMCASYSTSLVAIVFVRVYKIGVKYVAQQTVILLNMYKIFNNGP